MVLEKGISRGLIPTKDQSDVAISTFVRSVVENLELTTVLLATSDCLLAIRAKSSLSHVDCHPHPGMDAALIMLVFGFIRRIDITGLTRRD